MQTIPYHVGEGAGFGIGFVLSCFMRRKTVFKEKCRTDSGGHASGTRISLDSTVYAFRHGASPESIREDFDGLSLPHLYGAIAFYLDNHADMDAYLAARKEPWLKLERQGTPPDANLLARLERTRRQTIPLSTQ